MFKFIVALILLPLLFFACNSSQKEDVSDSNSQEIDLTDSISERAGIVGCWRLSKIGFNLDDINDESKWQVETSGTVLLLRDDGKFMKWFGDYMDIGDFRINGDTLLLDQKNLEENEKFNVVLLNSSELILTRENRSIQIEAYEKQEQDVYEFWNDRSPDAQDL
jgi:hypothetical protein